jgi:PAS domain S-box-containing protein
LEIEQIEKRFKALVQNGSDLISIVDFEANFHYVTHTSKKILGISSEEFIGQNAFKFIHPDEKEAVYLILSRLKTEKQIMVESFRFKHKDSSLRWMETIYQSYR